MAEKFYSLLESKLAIQFAVTLLAAILNQYIPNKLHICIVKFLTPEKMA
jgi:hypothetical protein